MSRLQNSTEREETVAEVLLDCIRCPEDGDQVLIVDDVSGRLDRLDGKGASLHHWTRYGRQGQDWPEGGLYDMATLRLNRDKEAFELSLHAVLSVLKPEASLWIYGANDEGMKSLPRRLKELVGDSELVDLRKRCRVIRVQRPVEIPGLRDTLDDWARETELPLPSGSRSWRSFPGIFAKGTLDPATAALIEVLPSLPAKARVLDFASGPGTISAELIAREPSLQLALLDFDALALSAAKENIPGASYLLSDSWHRAPGRHRWDHIVSNPPIHRGHSQDLTVLEDLITGAPLRLTPEGSLWFVCLSHLPVVRIAEGAFGENVEIAWTDGRFTVWHCRRMD